MACESKSYSVMDICILVNGFRDYPINQYIIKTKTVKFVKIAKGENTGLGKWKKEKYAE